MEVLPLISIIMATYNRANTLPRAIASVKNQTFTNWELIVVDDGSTDNTIEVMTREDDPRIKFFSHAENIGVTAAKNTGLDQIQGDWFTFLDSDDEMMPHAIERMLKVPSEININIDAITCNCIDTTTKKMSGKGIIKNQFLSAEQIALQCSGEFWGITKTRLLKNNRFNENLLGEENTLWYRINQIAKRYYIHEALRIYHTEGNDRICGSNKIDRVKKARHYNALKHETHFLELTEKYNTKYFLMNCFQGIVYALAAKDRETSRFFFNQLKKSQIPNKTIYAVLALSLLICGKPAGDCSLVLIQAMKNRGML